MPQFSLFVRVQTPDRSVFSELLASLTAQTLQDWELVLVFDPAAPQDLQLMNELMGTSGNLRCILRPVDEHLAKVCNELLPTLGTWIGFLDQHDKLVPDALGFLAQAAGFNPSAQVIYSNECRLNQFNRPSYITQKGEFDPVRLLAQEYLGALAVVRRSLLTPEGFDPLCSDSPSHDLYLRTWLARGNSAFCHVPEVLCQHHRDYREPPSRDPRRQPHMTGYDLHAIRQHLVRAGLEGEVHQEHGIARVFLKPARAASVGVWLILGDDEAQGVERIHALNRTATYRPAQFRIVHRGVDARVYQTYTVLARALGWEIVQSSEPLPRLLNQELPITAYEWLLLLDGAAINRGWLENLMGYAGLPGTAALTARCTGDRRIAAPGALGYWYEGWDWNTRGRFNRLQVPHQIGALGSSCLLFSAAAAREIGGFREQFPSLWAMDFSIRLDQAGHSLIAVPGAHVHVIETQVTDPGELSSFRTEWAGWRDRFGLHHSL